MPAVRGPHRRAISRRALLRAAITWTALLRAGVVRSADDPFPTAASAYLVKIDERILWAGRAEQRLPPASLTKIMTARLALARGDLTEMTTVSAYAAAALGTRLGLRRGERISVSDLLTATVVRSANDACRALAEWHSGSEAGFVREMNEHAVRAGLGNTHFTNASGFDAPGHYSSAADIARLAEHALADPRFAQITRMTTAQVSTAGGRSFVFENTNALLGRLPGAIGVKSGFTSKAGQCIAAAAERNGVRVLLVMLNARNRWWDAHGMMERAFALAQP
jgi:D-alanyl-D-alanine carboxypeptidase (penicillin-binding protein 5/6)